MPSARPPSIQEVERVLSTPRFATYLRVAQGDTAQALELYIWNARVSAALMVPAHFAEVAVRNAVDEVLTVVYGTRWPWDPTFENSLPTPVRSFNPRKELRQTRGRHATTGKVVADLKFIFWETMFTARHDVRLWNPHLTRVFPHAEPGSPSGVRQAIHNDLDEVRGLRNRMAHHEPLLREDLNAKLDVMARLSERRTAPWPDWGPAIAHASSLISARP